MAAEQSILDYEMIGKEFVQAYYTAFDADRSQIVSVYHPSALLTYATRKTQGHDGIREVFKNLSFQKVQHVISTSTFQPMANGNILIFVLGKLRSDEDQPMDFSETFVLANEAGNWCIMNDIFCLGLHDF